MRLGWVTMVVELCGYRALPELPAWPLVTDHSCHVSSSKQWGDIKQLLKNEVENVKCCNSVRNPFS